MRLISIIGLTLLLIFAVGAAEHGSADVTTASTTASTSLDADESGADAAAAAPAGVVIQLATGAAQVDPVTGAVLCVLAFVGMMFQSRQMHARLGVLVLMAIGAIGLAATGVTVALALPDVRTWMLLILVVATVVLIGLTLLTPKARLRLTRLGDTVEVVALALLLPLGVITAGLV